MSAEPVTPVIIFKHVSIVPLRLVEVDPAKDMLPHGQLRAHVEYHYGPDVHVVDMPGIGPILEPFDDNDSRRIICLSCTEEKSAVVEAAIEQGLAAWGGRLLTAEADNGATAYKDGLVTVAAKLSPAREIVGSPKPDDINQTGTRTFSAPFVNAAGQLEQSMTWAPA